MFSVLGPRRLTMHSHFNSLGNNVEKGTAGCRAFLRMFIVTGAAVGGPMGEGYLNRLAFASL